MKVLAAFKVFRQAFASAIHNGSTTAQAKKQGLDAVKKMKGINWAALIQLLMPLIEKFISAWLGQ